MKVSKVTSWFKIDIRPLLEQYAPLLLMFLGPLIFGYSLHFGFIFDDEPQILLNSMVHSVGNFLQAFTGSTLYGGGSASPEGIYYKPLLTLSYMFLWSLFGGRAWSFHAVQLFLHIGNSILIYLFLKDLLEPRLPKVPKLSLIPISAALLFLIHPINVEAVVYIADLQDPLFTFFGLSTLFLFSRIRKSGLKEFVLVAGGMLATLLSKESGLLYLIMIPLYASFFQRRKLSLAIFSFIVALSTYLFLRIGIANLTSVAFNETQMHQADWQTRLMTAPLVLWHYFYVFFFPRTISVAQDWAVRSPDLFTFWLPLLAVLVISGVLLILARRLHDKIFSFFVLWAAFGLGVHSQILFPLDGTVADRWFYFPIIGFLGAAAALVSIFEKKKTSHFLLRLRPLAKTFLILLVTVLSIRSFARTLDWQDAITLSAHDLKTDPDNFYLNNNMGVELFRQNKYNEALPYFKKATQLSPKSMTTWSNLGATYSRMGKEDLAEPCYLKSIQIGHYYLAYENYARELFEQHRYAELRKFLESDALVYYPNNTLLRTFYQNLPKDPSLN